MIDYATFSRLRLRTMFPSEFLAGCPWYAQVDETSAFEMEYLGGAWDVELIDGVQFWFPECNPDELGVVQLWGSRLVQLAPNRDNAAQAGGTLVPAWSANANRVLEALQLPVRFGDPENALHTLASGRVRCVDLPDRSMRLKSFEICDPDLYEVQATVHSTDGLLMIEIARPDVVRANEIDADDE